MRIVNIIFPVLVFVILLPCLNGYSQFKTKSQIVLSTDTIVSSYEVYDFIKGEGVEINKSDKKYKQQRVDIKKVNDSIKQIVFWTKKRIKIIDKNDSINRDGYNVYYQKVYLDGGKEYQSFLFINKVVAFSFTLSDCWCDKMYFYIIKTEGDQYKLTSSYIKSTNIPEIINYIEQNNYEINGHNSVKDHTFIYEQTIAKNDFGLNKAKQKFYLFWYSLVF